MEHSFALPAAEDLVPNTVARVAEVPAREGTIAKAEFRHALELVAVAAGRLPVPGPGERGYGRLESNAVGSLLEAIWLRGEAAEMGISVTPGQVARELAQIKRQSFEDGADYRRFLKESHYTRRDVSERVELQLLSVRVQVRFERQVAKEADSAAEKRQVFNRLVREFSQRWRGRTVCAPQYATERCSNGPTVR